MTSAVALLERLLDGDVQQKEHILETFSPHLGELETRMNSTFDKLVSECGAILGTPDFSSAPLVDGEKPKTPLPGWSAGTPRGGGPVHTLRLTYWKRPDSFYYIALRTEIHPQKEKPMHYDLLVGAKKRKEELRDSASMDKLRNSKPHWISRVLPFFTGRPNG